MRSWLFVPGDSERKLARAAGCGADIVVLDLEDSVATDRKPAARGLIAEYLQESRCRTSPSLWVRVNPPASRDCAADLAAILPVRPHGILLPKVRGVHDVVAIDAQLDDGNDIQLAAIATETATGVANLGGYADHPPRLVALAWGAEDLATELGASRNRDASGRFVALFRHVRAQFRLAAAAAGLPAIDTIHANYADDAGLRAYAESARADGFAGMLAIHPNQVAIVNAAFTPSADEVAAARRIVAAFDAGDGVVAIDGRMLDRPHLVQARRVLELAEGGD